MCVKKYSISALELEGLGSRHGHEPIAILRNSYKNNDLDIEPPQASQLTQATTGSGTIDVISISYYSAILIIFVAGYKTTKFILRYNVELHSFFFNARHC